MNKPVCPRLSRQAKSARRNLDNCDEILINLKMESVTRRALARKKARETLVTLGHRGVVITWRFHGEMYNGRRVIHWDRIDQVDLKQHEWWHAYIIHIVVGLTTTTATAMATVIYQRWGNVIVPLLLQ